APGIENSSRSLRPSRVLESAPETARTPATVATRIAIAIRCRTSARARERGAAPPRARRAPNQNPNTNISQVMPTTDPAPPGAVENQRASSPRSSPHRRTRVTARVTMPAISTGLPIAGDLPLIPGTRAAGRRESIARAHGARAAARRGEVAADRPDD